MRARVRVCARVRACDLGDVTGAGAPNEGVLELIHQSLVETPAQVLHLFRGFGFRGFRFRAQVLHLFRGFRFRVSGFGFRRRREGTPPTHPRARPHTHVRTLIRQVTRERTHTHTGTEVHSDTGT